MRSFASRTRNPNPCTVAGTRKRGRVKVLGHGVEVLHFAQVGNMSWLVVWNMAFICFYDFPIILGMSSSQLLLTPSFFRGVGWSHQPVRIEASFLCLKQHPLWFGLPWLTYCTQNHWTYMIDWGVPDCGEGPPKITALRLHHHGCCRQHQGSEGASAALEDTGGLKWSQAIRNMDPHGKLLCSWVNSWHFTTVGDDFFWTSPNLPTLHGVTWCWWNVESSLCRGSVILISMRKKRSRSTALRRRSRSAIGPTQVRSAQKC